MTRPCTALNIMVTKHERKPPSRAAFFLYAICNFRLNAARFDRACVLSCKYIKIIFPMDIFVRDKFGRRVEENVESLLKKSV